MAKTITKCAYRNRVVYPNSIPIQTVKLYVGSKNQKMGENILHQMAINGYAGWYYDEESDTYSIIDTNAATKFFR